MLKGFAISDLELVSLRGCCECKCCKVCCLFRSSNRRERAACMAKDVKTLKPRDAALLLAASNHEL